MTRRSMRSTTASIALAAASWPGVMFAQPVELLDFTLLSEACQAVIIADGTIDPLTLTTTMIEIADDLSCIVLDENSAETDAAPLLAVEPEPLAEETMTDEVVDEKPVVDATGVEDPAVNAETIYEAPSLGEFSFRSLSDECQATIIADGKLDILTLTPEQLIIADNGTCEIVVATGEESVLEPEPEIVGEVAPPAAASETDDNAEENADATEVISETVTDETTRSSDEEVVAAVINNANDNSDTRDLAKILGAVGVGIVIGTLLDNNDTVVGDTGDRVIVERDGRYIVRNDENELLRRPGSDIRTEEFSDGSTRTIVTREDGVRIVTIRDSEGYVVRRTRFMPDGREFVLFDDTVYDDEVIIPSDLPPVGNEPAYADYSTVDEDELLRALQAAELRDQTQTYSLRQIRENASLRASLPRVDIDVITFATGSSAITTSQAQSLAALGRVMAQMIVENPAEVFLIEGHTDAVGSEIANLALSDRRAETVALALTEYFAVPPENMVVQGYGEEFLKVQTLGDERANRRTAVRRITNLLGA